MELLAEVSGRARDGKYLGLYSTANRMRGSILSLKLPIFDKGQTKEFREPLTLTVTHAKTLSSGQVWGNHKDTVASPALSGYVDFNLIVNPPGSRAILKGG